LKRAVFQRSPIIQTKHNIQINILRYFIDDASNSQLTEGEKYLYEKLHSKFQPIKLHVEDISGGCGSMYAIEISSKAFKGLSVIKQHRLVNDLLQDDIKKMHGIRLKTSAD